MNRQQRRKLERLHKKNQKNFRYETIMMKVSDFNEKTQPMDIWTENVEKEKKEKKSKRLKGSTPLQYLEEKGYEYKTIDNELVVMISKVNPSDVYTNMMEGVYTPKVDDKDWDSYKTIPIEKVVDYNSVWELTQSGWYSGMKTNPFIGIRVKGSTDDWSYYRWDNSNVLRPICGTMNWDKKNYELCRKLDPLSNFGLNGTINQIKT